MNNLQRVITAALLIISSIGTFWFLQEAPTTDNNIAQNGQPTLRWQTKKPQRYKVEMDSSIDLNAGSGQAQHMNVSIRSQLELQMLDTKGTNVTAGIKLSNTQLRISGQTDPEVNQALEKPFRVKFSAGAVPTGFEFPEGLTAQEQSILENIVRTFTVSAPENKQAWVASEKNASGAYKASYARISTNKFKKTKHDFIAASSSPMLANAEITSAEKIHINPKKNWIASMSVEETLQTPQNNGSSVRIINHAKIELMKKALASRPQSFWDFRASAPLPAVSTAQNSGPKLSPEEARSQLIAELPALDASNQGRTKHIHTLRDLLRADDSVPATLLEQMQTQTLSDRTRADLYLALELASTNAAQAALTTVITNPEWSHRDAMRATVALAGIDNPTPETLATLWDTAFAERTQLATTATYTLGSMGSHMKVSNNPDYPALRDNLLTGAYGSSNAQQRATFIYALGNTRDPDVAGDVTSFLEDEQPTVRRAAALSLGLMQTEQSSEVLITRFKQENSSAVRGAIAESLRTLPITDTSSAMVLINDAIQIEQDETARHAMANFMGTHLSKHPEYKPTLQKLLRQEPSKRVRQTIAEALAAR